MADELLCNSFHRNKISMFLNFPYLRFKNSLICFTICCLNDTSDASKIEEENLGYCASTEALRDNFKYGQTHASLISRCETFFDVWTVDILAVEEMRTLAVAATLASASCSSSRS